MSFLKNNDVVFINNVSKLVVIVANIKGIITANVLHMLYEKIFIENHFLFVLFVLIKNAVG